MVRNRAWLVTCNYKTKPIVNNSKLDLILNGLEGIRYFKYRLEISESKTFHHHIFLYFQNYVNFSSIQNVFTECHIQQVKDGYENAIAYLEKGDYKASEMTEWGKPPSQGKRSDLSEILAMSKALVPLTDIRDTYPSQFYRYKSNIESIYYDVLYRKYKKIFRRLKVIFIHGKTNQGKSRYVQEKYNYELYRITNYTHPFDSYNGEDVIVFDEFRNSIPITEMLNYLDGYPLNLKARYRDKVACYTKVYIISNWSFDALYKKEQKSDKNTYNAFKRRFTFMGTLNEVKKFERENDL